MGFGLCYYAMEISIGPEHVTSKNFNFLSALKGDNLTETLRHIIRYMAAVSFVLIQIISLSPTWMMIDLSCLIVSLRKKDLLNDTVTC